MRPSRRALGAVALVVLICLAVPAGASGAVLTRLNNSLFFQDFAGEVNQVTYGLSGGNHTFTDTGAPIDTDFGANGGDGNLQNDECAPVPADSRGRHQLRDLSRAARRPPHARARRGERHRGAGRAPFPRRRPCAAGTDPTT